MKLYLLLIFSVVLEAAVHRTKLQHHRPHQSNVLRSKRDGKVPLNEHHRDIFTIDVNVGTPPQKFMLELYPFGSISWIVSKNCTAKQCHGYPVSGYTKQQYDSDKSTTYVSTDGSAYSTLAFEDNGTYSYRVHGYSGIDIIEFAGLKLDGMEFVMADEIPNFCGYRGSDGIMFLGHKSVDGNETDNVADHLIKQLEQPWYTIWMNKNAYEDGLVTFGDVDTEHCESDIKWLKHRATVYGVQMGNYTNQDEMGFYLRISNSVINGPSAVIRDLLRTIGAHSDSTLNMYTVDCSARSTAPDLVFDFKEFQYTVSPATYIEDWRLGKNQCVVMFEYELSIEEWRFSSDLNRQYCQTHDIVNNKIGFAKAK